MEEVKIELLHETTDEMTVKDFANLLLKLSKDHPGEKISLCGITAGIKIHRESDGYIVLDNEYLSNEG